MPQCNLLFAQLYNEDSGFTTLFPNTSHFFQNYSIVSGDKLGRGCCADSQTSTSSAGDNNVLLARLQAGTGVGANCEIAHVGTRGSIGDVGQCAAALWTTS